MNRLGTTIKSRREELGYSQKKLGKMIDQSDSYVSRIEKGQDITLTSLSRLASALNIELIDLLVLSGHISNESIKKHQLVAYKDCSYLSKMDCEYISAFIESLISSKKEGAEK